jgi:hypothetical protein
MGELSDFEIVETERRIVFGNPDAFAWQYLSAPAAMMSLPQKTVEGEFGAVINFLIASRPPSIL